ncbi:uncharacterized protein Z520_12329 [Fonsecaea multimorphosa CBS 102226]|uniref:Uncharacterized protein n=1 Tax=Fonsecaea multimorphosa CBS 102226 TaxID=1442371 RepID=A0A0D2GR21_9EURO|nr:uncharacterized protein Z520_12329 [Fonsecaea multimorphosa CBS 102226]KIX91940.1 hypothetical protein Z520_12329 [Fonsecaea multimorphosa CBS 102226]OAL17311.1 hypothetical protein AYO22_11753 [Fonsecaea multimorphosa]
MDCGGVGLYSTAADYAKLLGGLLSGGQNILKPDTVHELLSWQLPDASFVLDQFFGEYHAILPPEFPKDMPLNYGLVGAINRVDIPGKRRAGSVMWYGIANCRWWLDHKSGIAARLFVQILPPGDGAVSELYDELERAIYQALGARSA